ncbi:MAG: hypothetical protein WC011_03840 [Candidatus Paceibacterota bacterium]
MENQSHLTPQGSENEPKTEADKRRARIEELLEKQKVRDEKIEEIEAKIAELKTILEQMQKEEQVVKIRKEHLDPEIEALIDNLKVGIQSFADNTPGLHNFKNSEMSFEDTRGFAGYERHRKTRVYINPESIETLPEERKIEIIEQLPNQNLPVKKYPKIEGEIFALDPTVKYVEKRSKLEEKNNPYFVYIKPNYFIDTRGGVFSVLIQFEKKHTDILNLEVLEKFRIKFDDYINSLYIKEKDSTLESYYKKETINKIKTGEITNEAKEEAKRILKEVVLEYENKDAIQAPVKTEIEDKKNSEEKQEILENSIEQKQVFSASEIEVGVKLDEKLKNETFKIESTTNPHEYTFSLDNEGYRVKGFHTPLLMVAKVKGKKQGEDTFYKKEDLRQKPGIVEIKNGVITKIIKQLEIQFLPEGKTEEPKIETKRDGRENYEGWETRYNHDIEEGGTMKITKETKIQTSRSLYELKVKENKMVLFVIESKDTASVLIQYGMEDFETVFNGKYEDRKELYKTNLIKTVRPAKFRKEGDLWVLEEKGEVEYIK